MSEGDTEQWGFKYEAYAASRYDGDHECQYESCEDTADWLVDCTPPGYTGGRAFFCCQSCSRSNRIYARENDLYETDVSGDLVDVLPPEEVQHVRDLHPTNSHDQDGGRDE